MKAATQEIYAKSVPSEISIHAAREGGDNRLPFKSVVWKEFQSTPPVKAATAWTNLVTGIANISIHAAREGGDPRISQVLQGIGISIHAAREGGDAANRRCLWRECRFQSTPPVKAATSSSWFVSLNRLFQSTPRVKAATGTSQSRQDVRLFQSTPPVKAATLMLP